MSSPTAQRVVSLPTFLAHYSTDSLRKIFNEFKNIISNTNSFERRKFHEKVGELKFLDQAVYNRINAVVDLEEQHEKLFQSWIEKGKLFHQELQNTNHNEEILEKSHEWIKQELSLIGISKERLIKDILFVVYPDDLILPGDSLN